MLRQGTWAGMCLYNKHINRGKTRDCCWLVEWLRDHDHIWFSPCVCVIVGGASPLSSLQERNEYWEYAGRSLLLADAISPTPCWHVLLFVFWLKWKHICSWCRIRVCEMVADVAAASPCNKWPCYQPRLTHSFIASDYLLMIYCLFCQIGP